MAESPELVLRGCEIQCWFPEMHNCTSGQKIYHQKGENVAKKKKKNGGQNDALKKLMKIGLLSKLA